MACPAGYTEKDLHLLNGAAHPGIDNHDVEKAVTAFKQICEPTILRTEIFPEPVMFLASQYSILMQWLKYGLARGSLDHSDFANRVLRRLVNTTRYLNSVVYGDAEQQANIASVIHRYHKEVKAEKDAEGDSYYADDPELHRWTAATLFVGFCDVYEMIWGPMDTKKKTQLMKECSVFGTGLRMPPDQWFDDLDSFYSYWNHEVATLEVTYWARELANMLLYPKLPWFLAPIGIPFSHYMRVMTIYFLPPRVREGYGLKFGKGRNLLHKLYLQPTKIGSKITPRFIRHGLMKPGIRDMKKSSKRIEKKGSW
jgi:uncharacterized protein (DUF2236 family)